MLFVDLSQVEHFEVRKFDGLRAELDVVAPDHFKAKISSGDEIL